MDKLLLTIPEVAHRLGLGRSFTYQLVMSGEIPSIKLGRARRVPVTALEEFIAARLEQEVQGIREVTPAASISGTGSGGDSEGAARRNGAGVDA